MTTLKDTQPPWVRREVVSLVYVAASPNSGTTLLALLANAHPQIYSPGELMGPGGLLHGPEGPECACGLVVAECPFWAEVGERMAALGHVWRPDDWRLTHDRDHRGTPLLTRLLFGRPGPGLIRDRLLAHVPGLRRRVRDMVRRNADHARTVLALSGRDCLVDTSKPPERMIRLARNPAIDLQAVHLVRDPRGWFWSRKKAGYTDLAANTRQWVRRNVYMARLIESLPPTRWMRLRYEDLCAAPQESMDRIAELAGLPPAPLPRDISTIHAHLLGNNMRLRRDRAIREDRSWRDNLTAEEVAAVQARTAALARRFGYEW